MSTAAIIAAVVGAVVVACIGQITWLFRKVGEINRKQGELSATEAAHANESQRQITELWKHINDHRNRINGTK